MNRPFAISVIALFSAFFSGLTLLLMVWGNGVATFVIDGPTLFHKILFHSSTTIALTLLVLLAAFLVWNMAEAGRKALMGLILVKMFLGITAAVSPPTFQMEFANPKVQEAMDRMSPALEEQMKAPAPALGFVGLLFHLLIGGIFIMVLMSNKAAFLEAEKISKSAGGILPSGIPQPLPSPPPGDLSPGAWSSWQTLTASRQNGYAGTSCLSCRNMLNEGDEVAVCPNCASPYHAHCHRELERCCAPECVKRILAER